MASRAKRWHDAGVHNPAFDSRKPVLEYHGINWIIVYYMGVATCILTIPLHHPAPETSHALPGRKTPRYDPVMPGTMRQGLSNTLYAPTTPERVTFSPCRASPVFRTGRRALHTPIWSPST
jgi:hypothetical protein